MVEIGGSAKYLSDSKISSKQARVTLKYKTTTKYKELAMNHIGRGNVEYPYVFELGQATHVVTGILYGAQAFFVFDREVSEKENKQDIEGNLKVLIKTIANMKIDGQGSLKMADKDIENVGKFSCKFHGDFNLEKIPATFQEAIEVYQSLPKLLGTNRENAVPQKVWLMPLKTLDPAAAQLVRQISDGLNREAQNILEDLSGLERRCNDAERCKTAHVKKNVRAFKELVLKHKLKLQNNMKRTLPLIRGGGEEEGVLAKILGKVHSSPFQSDKLNEWMDYKGTEIIIISSLIDKMSKMVTVTSRTTLQQEIHSADISHAVCFVFTSLEGPEPYLSALSNYLGETQTDNVPCAYNVEKEQWFSSNDVMDKVQEKVKVFKDFAEANKENKSIRFLTAEMRDNVKKGATLHLYKDGSLVTDSFEPPSKPEMIIRDITHNSVTLNISPPRFGLTTVTHYTVEFCVHGEDVWHQQMVREAGDVIVSGLKINGEYQFRVRAKCAVGLGPACEDSPLIKLLPSSPPEKLQVKCYSTELSVSWEKPSELGSGVEIKQYILEHAETSPEVKPEEFIWSKLTFTANASQRVTVIAGLQPSTRYTVRVRCDCGVSGLGKEESVLVCTKKLSDRLATSIKACSKEIEPGSPSVFKIPLKKNDIRIDGCESYTFGEDSARPNRTLMFLGATGSGKSTLINGMINYVLGVDWKHPFRFKLINEDQSRSQAESQTTHVTTYKINHQEGFKVPYSLTLVDTPGFGNTRGIESDRAITEQIRSLFTSAKGVFEIDAICFVTQASQVRLTAAQKYVFDSVLSIFGKDVAENICILVTFADADDKKMFECSAMKDGKCRVCPGNCVWNVHFNQKYKWDYVEEKQVTTVQELKEKYEKATEAKITVQQLIEIQEEEVAHLQDEIILLMDTSSACLARLKEIALRPDPLSTPEYIDLLIEGEKKEGKEGYLARIQCMEKMKGNAQIIAKVSEGEQLTRPEEEYLEASFESRVLLKVSSPMDVPGTPP
ncbi:unnamed protein product [Boreogadus saida]